jgi:hypothetical protein
VKPFLLCLFFLFIGNAYVHGQQPDTGVIKKDTLVQAIAKPVNLYDDALQFLFSQHKFLNTSGKPTEIAVRFKKVKSKDVFFYLITTLLLLLGVLKFFYNRYFNTIFRVFFNTSLRQSQLSDQLLQAKLPSLFFNLFFVICGGVYSYFLLRHYGYINESPLWMPLGFCILILGIIYLVKYSTLKFTGWVTGYKETTDTYVFIIFLICKILGIILLPFIILMVFTDAPVAAAAALSSLLVIGFVILLRFFRSFGLLQNQLKISKFHFLLYIAGVEVIPLLLIYKGVLILLSKNI